MPAQPRFAAVIFDMDGVLIDSYSAHFRSWELVSKKSHKVITDGQFAAGFGRTSREVIQEHWGEAAADPETVRAIDEEKERLFRDIIRANPPIMAGVMELIGALGRAGFALGIGSSGPRENVEMCAAWPGFAGAFHAVVTGSDVKHGKPDPEVFLLVAERLGVEPERCVVIEDAPVGVQAAQGAGMAAIALLSTGRKPEDFRVWRPEMMVQKLSEVTAESVTSLLNSRLKT